MLTAKCARDAGVSDNEIQTHGYSVVALELGSSGWGDGVGLGLGEWGVGVGVGG